MGKLPSALIQAFEADLAALNERFGLRRRAGARIDAAAFLSHLERTFPSLINPIDTCLPERTRVVVSQLYEASLDLFAASQLGPTARTRYVEGVWQDLLPRVLPRVLALHPQQVAGCLSNAVFKIASQPGARPADWLANMQRLAPYCASIGDLLDVGKVAAWRAGMVQYRHAALAIAERLPAALAARAFGLPEDQDATRMPEMLARLRGSIWLDAAAAATSQATTELRCVATAGGFTGFGGIFARPPIVVLQGSRFVTTDQQNVWDIHFDVYGVWFQRVERVYTDLLSSAGKAEASIDRHGLLRWGKHSLSSPELVSATSIACDGETAVITLPTSHRIFFYSCLRSAV